MSSHSDQQHRTLNYVEVIYLDKKGQPATTKFQHYPEDECERVFQRTINKFKQEKKNVLVNLRTETHQLLKSEWCRINGF